MPNLRIWPARWRLRAPMPPAGACPPGIRRAFTRSWMASISAASRAPRITSRFSSKGSRTSSTWWARACTTILLPGAETSLTFRSFSSEFGSRTHPPICALRVRLAGVGNGTWPFRTTPAGLLAACGVSSLFACVRRYKIITTDDNPDQDLLRYFAEVNDSRTIQVALHFAPDLDALIPWFRADTLCPVLCPPSYTCYLGWIRPRPSSTRAACRVAAWCTATLACPEAQQ